MHRLITLCGCALVGLALNCNAARAQDGEGAAGAAAVRDLSSEVETLIEKHALQAIGVLVLQDGAVVAQGAAGVRKADEPNAEVTVDDPWHIGSCGKAITATLAARLVEAEVIDWDTTVGASFDKVEGLTDRILPVYHDVTLRQLLSHRSGLPEDRQPDPTVWLPARALKGPLRQQRRDVVGLVMSREPVSEPGSSMAYSNFGYVVAAAMMEEAADESFETLVQQQIFDPLEMGDSGFGPPTGDAERIEAIAVPWGHRFVGHKYFPVKPELPLADNPQHFRPAGGLHVTLRDWSRFAQAHIDGATGASEEFLSESSWGTLHEDVYGQDYALGWVVGERAWAGGTTLNHAGSNGMWFAVIWIAPERRLAIMAVTNGAGPNVGAATDEAVVTALRLMREDEGEQ